MALFGRDYDRDFGYYGRPRGGGWRYDEDYGMGAAGEYDREFGYKSRWQTDYGDPFGDRISHTPMRMIRGDFHHYGAEYEPRERGWRTRFRGGYSPYEEEEGYGRRGWGREGAMWGRSRRGPGGYRGSPYDRSYVRVRYDQGWF